MIRKLLIFPVLALLMACGTGVQNQQAADEKSAEDKGYYGDKISGEDPVTGEDLVSLLQEKDSVWVTMRSTIVSNCQASGCWMDLDLGTGEVVKVTFKDYAFFIPIDSKGKTATIEGFAKKEVIPVDLLKHYAEDEGKTQEEIDAITQPELAYTFEAIGVIIDE